MLSIANVITRIITISLVLLLYNGAIRGSTHAMSLPENVTVPAIFIFGDSIVDPGNSNFIFSICRADHPPYGRDFQGGKATGRFSNAKIPSDFAAEEFGVKELLPAYLDPFLTMEDLLTGVSFGFTCSGYDPITSQIFGVPSLKNQLEHFKEWTQKVTAAVGVDRASYIISESIYLLVTGSNDFTFTYYGSPFRKFQYNMTSYTDLLISFGSTFLQDLYCLGARRIGATGLPPEGCLPAVRKSMPGGTSRECNEQHNQDCLPFNSKLKSLMRSLGKKHRKARFVYLDLYGVLLRLMEDPRKYGFSTVDRGCCGRGEIEVSILCHPFDPFTCKNDTEYVFFDSYHPTDAACKIIVHELLNGTIHQFF